MHLFVYYTTPSDASGSTLVRVRSMQAELGESSARLLKRPEAPDGVQTWMEIYEDVAEDFERRLARAVERHGLASLTGRRHIERFEEFG